MKIFVTTKPENIVRFSFTSRDVENGFVLVPRICAWEEPLGEILADRNDEIGDPSNHRILIDSNVPLWLYQSVRTEAKELGIAMREIFIIDDMEAVRTSLAFDAPVVGDAILLCPHTPDADNPTKTYYVLAAQFDKVCQTLDQTDLASNL